MEKGPLATYCGVRCEEEGLSNTWTNPGKCYLRLVALYGPLGILALPTMVFSVVVIRKLYQHASLMSNKKTGKKDKKYEIAN